MKQRKQILIIGKWMNLGGAETSLVNFANFASKNYDVTLCLLSEGILMDQLNKDISIDIHTGSSREYAKYAKEKGFDIIINFHDFNSHVQDIFNAVCKQLPDARRLTWIHGIRKNMNPVKMFLYKIKHKVISEIVFVSQEVKKCYLKSFGHKNPEKQSIIGNLITSDFSDKYTNTKKIINIARGTDKKNHPIMIDVLLELERRGNKFEFIQYGISVDNKYYEMYVDKLKNDNIKLIMGGKSETPWKEITGSLFLLTSNQGADPVVISESLSHGIPVITSGPINKGCPLENTIIATTDNDVKTFADQVEKSFSDKINSSKLISLSKKNQEDIKNSITDLLARE